VGLRGRSQGLAQGRDDDLVAASGELAAEVLNQALLPPDHGGVGLRQHQNPHRGGSYSRPSPPRGSCNLAPVPGQPNQQDAPTAPSISVIVTAFTFDRLDSIEEIVESMRRQTVAPAETLLVIDYAPDL